MEENQKQSKILEDCAEIAQSLKSNPYVSTTQIIINIPNNKFEEILKEIEEFVRIRVDRSQNKLSIDINEVEFIFTKD
jgi:adenosine deaminase